MFFQNPHICVFKMISATRIIFERCMLGYLGRKPGALPRTPPFRGPKCLGSVDVGGCSWAAPVEAALMCRGTTVPLSHSKEHFSRLGTCKVNSLFPRTQTMVCALLWSPKHTPIHFCAFPLADKSTAAHWVLCINGLSDFSGFFLTYVKRTTVFLPRLIESISGARCKHAIEAYPPLKYPSLLTLSAFAQADRTRGENLTQRTRARRGDLATYPDQATVPTTKGLSLRRGRFRSGESPGHSGKTRRKSSAWCTHGADTPPRTNCMRESQRFLFSICRMGCGASSSAWLPVTNVALDVHDQWREAVRREDTKTMDQLLQSQSASDLDVCLTIGNGWTPAHVACNQGHEGILTTLLSTHAVDPNQADDDGTTPLYLACQEGHKAIVTLLLGHDRVAPNQAHKTGATPLFIACQKGHKGVVAVLLETGHVEPNRANTNGATPLYIACQKGHEDVVGLLLGKDRVDPNQAVMEGTPPREGHPPLYVACLNGHEGVVALMLKDERVRPNQANHDGATPLYVACQNGHKRVVKRMLQSGRVARNQPNNNGATPLYIACQNGHKGTVKLMLQDAGVDPALAVHNGATPLWIACRKGHADIVRVMLKNDRVDPNQATATGSTPLMAGVVAGNCREVSLLISARCCIAAVDRKGWQCLHYAASEGCAGVDMCQLLLTHVPHLLGTPTCASGDTPLGLAVKKGVASKVKALLAHKADPNQLCGGLPPLHHAVQLCRSEAARALLEAGAEPTAVPLASAPLKMRPVLDPMYLVALDAAHRGLEPVRQCVRDSRDVNCQDEFGCTPLIAAMLRRDVGTVQYLLEHGADGGLGTKWGCRPAMWAKWMGLSDVVVALTARGIHLNEEGRGQLANLRKASAADETSGSVLALQGPGPGADGFQRRGVGQRRRAADSLGQRMADGAAETSCAPNRLTGMARPTQSLEAFVVGLAGEAYVQQFWTTAAVDSTPQAFLQNLLMMAKFFTANVVAAGASQLPPQLVMATYLYTAETPPFSFYYECNAALRSGSPERVACWHPFVYVLEEALRSIEPCSTQILYRGVGKRLPGYGPGKIIEWAAFSSTTAEYDVAVAFFGSQGMLFVIRGDSAKPIRIYSAFPEEEEWLYAPHSKFKVLGVAPYRPALLLGVERLFRTVDKARALGREYQDVAWIGQDQIAQHASLMVYMEQVK